ncbi:MAG: Cna B-type domain-containing protein, partial [Clostridia bacterium]|nr:Cna B-type domain-containing protein [Clostridia bacterium]
VTGNGLAGVQFQLKDANGDVVTLYKSVEGVYRLYQPGELIADGIVETDTYGRIFLGWAEGYPPGTLSLTEIDPPKGYTAILPVEFSIVETGQTVSITTTSEDAQAEDRILRIQNMPYTFNVDVQKVWLDGTNEEVEVELYRVSDSGKTRIGDPVVLNALNNWQHRWTDQALYDGNEAAQYEVREIRIGNTYYSSTADKARKCSARQTIS